MEEKDYQIQLAKLITSFHSLEFLIRMFLHKINESIEQKIEIETVKEGEWVKINSFTNYDSLRKLINKYNNTVGNSDQNAIDDAVVTVRDALAHGRVAGKKPSFPLELLKFGPENSGKVQVEIKVELNEQWLSENIELTQQQIQKVIKAFQERNLKGVEKI